jgi:hypothetical protein
MELNAISFSDVLFNDKIGKQNVAEDDQPTVEEYYRLLANLLLIMSRGYSRSEIRKLMSNMIIAKQLTSMKPLILEDNIF